MLYHYQCSMQGGLNLGISCVNTVMISMMVTRLMFSELKGSASCVNFVMGSLLVIVF